tara:strand:+ start:2782 stop:3561 length:780 start_codon:yes stop_codon:yes gene_type:complete
MADGIPNTQSARRDSHQVFSQYINTKGTDPSMGNLYSVVFTPPDTLMYESDNSLYKDFQGGKGNKQMHRQLNMYATAVNLPSKQLTTGQVLTQGAPYKYVTGTAYSQINITFMMPRDHSIRMLFEAWMNTIIADSNQYIEDYDNYVCKYLRIYKFERGFGEKAFKDPGYDGQMREQFGKNKKTPRLNELTACFELQNVFPFNIGSAQLNNNDARLITYGVGLNFERYRFIPHKNAKPQLREYGTQRLRENIALSSERLD